MSGFETQQQQHQRQRGPCSSTCDAATLPSCSVQQLLRYVRNKGWHTDNAQLHVVRHKLAEHIVQTANAGRQGRANATTCENSYILQGGRAGKKRRPLMLSLLQRSLTQAQQYKESQYAGEIVSRAWLAVFSGHQRCYSTMTDALAGSPYFSTYMGDSSQTVVQLNIKLLLLEAASEVQYGSNPHIDASAISCTVQQLLQHVQCSLWDTNNRQLHVVRQALALHIVQDVNMGRPLHSNAVAHRDAYSLRRSRAGHIVGSAWESAFTGQMRCFTSLTSALKGSHYFSTGTGKDAQSEVMLNVQLLLHEAASQQPQRVGGYSSCSSAQQQKCPQHPAAVHNCGHEKQGQQHGAFVADLQQAPAPGMRLLLNQRLPQEEHSIVQLEQEQMQGPVAPLAGQHTSRDGQELQQATSNLLLSGLTKLQFKLLLQQRPAWHLPFYLLFTSEQNSRAAATEDDPVDAAGEALPHRALIGVAGSCAVVAPAACSNTLDSLQAMTATCGSTDNLQGAVDEAVHSMLLWLPASLQSHIEPYLDSCCSPQLVEVIIDTHRPVTLRFSDRSCLELPCIIDIRLALACLHRAKQSWKQPMWGAARMQGHVEQQRMDGMEGPGAQEGSTHPTNSNSSCSEGDGSSPTSHSIIAAAAVADALAATPLELTTARKRGYPSLEGEGAVIVSSKRNKFTPLLLSGLAWHNGNPAPGPATLGVAANAGGSATATMFGSDQRMGVPGTLHRISAMRDKQGQICGLTYRIGRHVPGVALLLADLLSSMKASLDPEAGAGRPQSLLLLGRPGVGKTTLLRDIARLMSLPPDQGGLGLMVIIVDTSNEIAGDAEECHPCIGKARRMMVPHREQQAGVLVQAVQNHNPDVIIVDEIGTEKEVRAARTISQRGVLLIGTAHGITLSNLLTNPELKPLVGGVKEVTLGDVEAKKTNRGHKTRLERAGATTFVTLLELQTKNRWRLHLDVEHSVDRLLRAPPATEHSGTNSVSRAQCDTQTRSRDESGRMLVQFESPGAARQALKAAADVAAAANL